MCSKYWFAADNKMKKRGTMGGEGKSPERSYDLSFSLEDVQALNKQKQGGYAIQKGCQQKFTCACIWICSSFPSQWKHFLGVCVEPLLIPKGNKCSQCLGMRTRPSSPTNTASLFPGKQRGIDLGAGVWHACIHSTPTSQTWGSFDSFTAVNYAPSESFTGSHCLPTQGVFSRTLIPQLLIGLISLENTTFNNV